MKRLLLITYIFLFSISLTSFEAEKEEWVVAFTPFSSTGLSLSNMYLGSVIPTYLFENVEKEFKHYLTVEEATEVNRVLLEEEIEKEYTNRLTKINERDSKIFSSENLQDDLATVEDEIKEIEERIDNLKSIEINRIDKLKEIELNIKEMDFISSDFQEIQKYLEDEKVDYLITGEIEEIDDNLFVKLLLYSRYLNKEQELFTGIGYSEDILNLREKMVEEINRTLISDDIITYEINVEPIDSLIYVDGVFKSIGNFKGSGIDGSVVEVTAVKEGYRTKTLQKVITAENSLYDLELDQLEEKLVTIRSNPSGVHVHYGSKYIGTTPVEIPVYSSPLKLSLSLEGYMDKSLTVTDNIKNQYIHMDSKIIDVDKNFEKSKDNFYLSMGIFSISLAIPLFFNSQEDLILSDHEYYPTLQNISIVNAVIWGGHLFYRLYMYLEAAKLSVE